MSTLQTIAHTPGGTALLLAAMLLAFWQLILLMFALRRRGWRAVLFALHLTLGLAGLTALLDGAYVLDYLPYTRRLPPFVDALYALPWAAIAGAEAADALVLGFCTARLRREFRRSPSLTSIKQAIDLLPTGVCISDADGTVLLSNLRMNACARLLTGAALTDARELRAAVRQQGRVQGDKWLVTCGDGTVLLFSEGSMELEGRRYDRLSAEDMTEQYKVTRALEERNARLRELQYRMRSYQVRASELLLREELLQARSTVHSQLGGALLTGRYHLEHPESTDPEALRQMLEQINTDLLAAAVDPEPRMDGFASAMKLAAGIGVRVTLTGEVPPSGPLREVLGKAIDECAANAVKHAGGDRLEVRVDGDGFTIEGNGAPPDGPIIPVGGLRSLQIAAEQAGGVMDLESAPRFRLRIRLEQVENA